MSMNRPQRSPFPGMDPFLEAKWPEVHASLIVYARNQINGQLPDDLQANIEENLSVYEKENEDDEMSRQIRPDLHLSEDAAKSGIPATSSDVAVAEPLRLKKPPRPERHIEITDAAGRVITAIEFLSPWNKIGSRAREQYTRKQLDYLDARVNLVEIDLIAGGKYVLAAPLDELRKDFPDRETPYAACISRWIQPNEIEFYPIALQQPLPNLPIPLRPHEPDVVLPLQTLLDDAYRDGRYYRIDYRQAWRPTFDDDKLERWITQQLADQHPTG